ncbi:hypothetical protein RUND412_004564 [Rhizina undulata]
MQNCKETQLAEIIREADIQNEETVIESAETVLAEFASGSGIPGSPVEAPTAGLVLTKRQSTQDMRVALGKQQPSSLAFCIGGSCRRKIIFQHFGEKTLNFKHPDPCCDVCGAELQEIDSFEILQMEQIAQKKPSGKALPTATRESIVCRLWDWRRSDYEARWDDMICTFFVKQDIISDKLLDQVVAKAFYIGDGDITIRYAIKQNWAPIHEDIKE